MHKIVVLSCEMNVLVNAPCEMSKVEIFSDIQSVHDGETNILAINVTSFM